MSAVRSSALKNKALLRVLKRRLRLKELRSLSLLGDRFEESTTRRIFSLGRAGCSSGGATSTVRSGFRACARVALQASPAGVTLFHLAGRRAETRAPHPFFTARNLLEARAARSGVHRPTGALPSKRASAFGAFTLRRQRLPPPSPWDDRQDSRVGRLRLPERRSGPPGFRETPPRARRL